MSSNIFKTPLRYIGVAAAIFAVMPSTAHAACSSPAGTKGEIIYNQDHSAMQYCDNTNWIAMGRPYSWPTPTTTGLVGHWKLDETSGTTASDSSGSGNNGTLTNMDGATDWVSGKLNNALDLDGGNDYVSVPLSSSLYPGTGSFSITSWFNWEESCGTDWCSQPTIIACRKLHGGRNDKGWVLGIFKGPSVNKYLSLQFGDSSTRSVNELVITPLIKSGYNHVVGVRDKANGNTKVYLNGTLLKTVSDPTGNIDSCSLPIKIGYGQHQDNYFNGQIDDVRIYNRALTAGEIEDLAMVPPDVTAGLVGHWKMDETSGTTASDSSGNGNNGTLTNMDGATDWVSGKLNNALDFDGANDRVTHSLSLNKSQGTISHWLKPAQLKGMVAYYESNGTSAGYNGFGTGMGAGAIEIHTSTSSNGTFSAVYEDGGAATQTVLFSVGKVNLGKWSHVIMTWNRADKLKIYINGVLDSYVDISGTTYASNTATVRRIGMVGDATSARQWDGAMDDVRVYNRELTSAEAGQLFCSSAAGKVEYNLDAHIMQYCAGAQGWTGMGQDKTGQTVNEPDLSAGLVGHWKLNETSGTTAVDSSGNGNNGTLTNMDGATDWVSGNLNNALDFDGSNDHVILLDSAIFDVGGSGTWCNWFYSSVNQVGRVMFAHDYDLANYKWIGSYLTGSSGNIMAYIRISGTVFSVTSGDNGAGFYNNQWHHVCSTFNRTLPNNRLKLFIDGNLVNTSDAADGDIDLGSKPGIGYWANSGYFDGKIDDVRIYDRALSAEEIKLLMLASCTNPTAPEGQMIYNDAQSLMQYCNGKDWVAVGK